MESLFIKDERDEMAVSNVVQSVARAADILMLVAESEDGLTLQALSQSLGLKPTTTYNLARTLTVKGLLQKVPRPVRYQLGASFYAMVAHSAERSLRDQASKAVQRLARRFPQATVTYCEPIANEIMNLLRMSPERPGVLERPRDRSMQPYVNAASLVFQAFWPPDQRLAYQQHHPFDEFGAQIWESEAALAEFLAEARQLGYVAKPGRKIVPVAVPVFSDAHELLATVGIAVQRDSLGDVGQAVSEIVRELSDTADWLSTVTAQVERRPIADTHTLRRHPC